jgi:hypothetical protein
MKRTQLLLIIALLLLVSVGVYYYAAVYMPSVNQANALTNTIEEQR